MIRIASYSQLRIYTINRGKMQTWIKEWREGIYPLRLKYGFKVEGAWVIERDNKFVWILTYNGPDSWENKDAAYYDSSDRKGIDPNPARHIAYAETKFISSILAT